MSSDLRRRPPLPRPRPQRAAWAALALAALLSAGCSRPERAAPEVPRPVKVEQLQAQGSTLRESFVGTLRARQRTELGFESPGRIASIAVDVGDRVHAGQVLATLDPAPAQRRLDKAAADRAAAAAQLVERTTQWRQHTALAQDEIVSATTLEAVATQRDVAAAQLAAADAALALARRDLALVRITAPFDGQVVARAAQPHADIGAGQPVLQLEAPQVLEVVAMLPDTLAARLVPGQTAAAALAGPDNRRVPLKLERLSAHSDNGTLVQAIFRVAAPPAGLRGGGVVSIEFDSAARPALSVPAQAVMPAAERGAGSVFVLDVARGRLVKRPVRLGPALLADGRLPVIEGLAAGERVVVAGTAFLTDGQAAVAHVAQTLLLERTP